MTVATVPLAPREGAGVVRLPAAGGIERAAVERDRDRLGIDGGHRRGELAQVRVVEAEQLVVIAFPKATASCAATRRVVGRQRQVCRDRVAAGGFGDVREHERRHRGTADAGLFGGFERTVERGVPDRSIECLRFGQGHGHEDTGAAERSLRVDEVGQLRDRIDAHRDGQPTRSHRERGELVGAEPDDRHAEHLEVLEGAGKIEERLRAGAHGHHRVAGDGTEIGTDVAAVLHAAVHAADASGREHTDTGPRREAQRRRDGARAECPALRDRDRDLAFARLARGAENAFVFVLRDADTRDAVEDRGDRRDRALHADGGEATGERVRVGRARQAEMREDRGLERDHGPVGADRVGDFVVDTDRWWRHARRHYVRSAPGDRSTRAARRWASTAAASGRVPCIHASRNPAANASPAPVVSTMCSTGGTSIDASAALRDHEGRIAAGLDDRDRGAGHRFVDGQAQLPVFVAIAEEDVGTQLFDQQAKRAGAERAQQ